MLMPFGRMLIASFVLASAILPAGAATLTITKISNGFVEATSDPFNLPDGSDKNGSFWSGVGATVTNSPTVSNLAIFGNFACLGVCSQYVLVDFTGTGFPQGYSVDLSLTGFASMSADLQAFVYTSTGGNSSLDLLGTGNGSFSASSSSTLVNNPGDFVGQMYVYLAMQGGNLSLPQGSTADLYISPTSSAVPEPATLGIMVGCLGLLVFVRRLRKS